jgi:uncharacterized integral membrane protein (TIGR00698 family)
LKIAKHINGVGLSLAIAVGAYLLGPVINFNAVLLALLAGIVLGNLVSLPKSFDKGIKTSASLLLEIAIVLLAFSIDYKQLIALGWQSILIVVVTMTGVLTATLWLSRALNCPGSTGWLVGFGTAICGSSAIAALAPRVTKDQTDIGISLAVVNLYGLIGMIALPLVLPSFFSDAKTALIMGSSLHSVGNVAGAGYAVSDSIGEISVAVKMGRVALLTPALLIFSIFLPKNSNQKGKSSLPWYLISFVIISILATFIKLPAPLLDTIDIGADVLLGTAMAAIGLRVSFRSLATAGKRGLLFGLLIFVVQLGIIGLMLWVLGDGFA